jgi:flagellar assembly protein FliH
LAANNVNSTSRIIKDNQTIEPYELGTFISKGGSNTGELAEVKMGTSSSDIIIDSESILSEIRNLTQAISSVQQKVEVIESEGVKSRDLDAQIVEALKDLKNYSAFFEQAAFQMETKILKTSLSIAQKVIGIEIGENSANIAKETITTIMQKLKTASKVTIHLNPKDYVVLKDQINFGEAVSLLEDANVTAGGVVIASDLGNFDGNIEAKVQSMLESLDAVI